MPQARKVHKTTSAARAASRETMISSIETSLRGLDMDRLAELEASLSAFRHVSDRDKAPDIIEGAGLGDALPSSAAEVALDAITVEDASLDWAASELVGAGEIAARLKIAPGTLANWRQARRVVAFRKGPRNYLYPWRQFDRFGPVEGLNQVVACFATLEDAWEWLVTPNRLTSSKAPLDRLKAKYVADVVRAAEGRLDFG